MTEDAFRELEELLREEREAIRRLDGARVLVCAERKEALVRAFKAGPMSPEGAMRLRALAPALRHNSVLLAHARDVLRDAISATRAGAGAPLATPIKPGAGPQPGAPAPRLISVRG
ncbi:MAG: hypothetical protein JOZ69_12100 [Myxococcales bacterium]|nr:hypothetical protein [Myxococcales bacterium]